MRILYHHRTRGTDAQRVHIVEMVNAFRKLGHDVDLSALVDVESETLTPEEEAQEAGWRKFVRRIPYSHEIVQLGYNLVGIPMMLWRLLRGNYDFVYERYALFNFSGVLAAALCRVPIVLEVNSPLALEQWLDNDIRALRLAAWTERAICNAATKVVVVTAVLRRKMIELGVRPEKLQVIPNGVNETILQRRPEQSALRESLGLGDDVVIGFVGWFRNWHNLTLLINAFQRSRRSGCKAKLMLIGDGPSYPDLRSYAHDAGAGPHVLFTGALPHDVVPSYLDLMDIAVQPAANEYCCPMKVIEYMALGKAIVAPKQPNLEELLCHGRQARFFRPGDEEDLAGVLTELITDPALRRRLGNGARLAISQRGFLWTKNAQRIIELLDGGKVTPDGEPRASRYASAR